MKKYCLFILLALGFTACEKQEVEVYNGPDGITFFTDYLSNDIITYTFVTKPIGTLSDTVYLDMRVLGGAKDYDRKISIIANSQSTARSGVDYKLLDAIVPKGELTIKYPVVVLNSPEMTENSYDLILDIKQNDDFVIGAKGREAGSTVGYDQFKLRISNMIEIPEYWLPGHIYYGNYIYFFGEPSETKLRFMVSVLGTTDFSPNAIGNYGFYMYPLKLSNALVEYEKVNGPLIDQKTGNSVTFPNN